MNKRIMVTLFFVIIGLFVVAFNVYAECKASEMKKVYVVQIRGSDVGETRMVPDIDGDGKLDEANCFDIEMVDLTTNKVIGTATDCLSNVKKVGDGLALVGTTYFNFENGTIVSRGNTSVQPATHEYKGVTHITGAAPSGGNDIISGTGEFEGATGSVRLSGMVDMSNTMDENIIKFDCIFVITLE
ncbi:MAG: hypothetical protein E3J23_04290 [Candidatus Stahlbacteria bacterium]|nr:MAG: hypothetical protein E3J23_04290 [Candidatus Stahlbacteria bacterium]